MVVLFVDKLKNANNDMAARNHTVQRLHSHFTKKLEYMGFFESENTFVTAAPLVRFTPF